MSDLPRPSRPRRALEPVAIGTLAILIVAGVVVGTRPAGEAASPTQSAAAAGGSPMEPSSAGEVSATAASEPTAGASVVSATVAPTAGATVMAAATATPVPSPAVTPVPTPVPTVAPTPAPTAACTLFPSSNVWNRDISGLPLRADSATLIASIGLDAGLHPDFSAAGGYGIPINLVSPSTPKAPVAFQYAAESDPGPYPIPVAPLIEGGSDRHLLMWDRAGCMLYELFAAAKGGSGWTAGSGAIWNLRSNALRPDGWTSADAAGLPILPGLVRYDEVARGVIAHALRFTAPRTRTAHIYPARHDAGESDSTSLPPMGLRVRLKSSVDISGFGPQARAVLAALQRYGMILADNGSPWYVTGAPDPRWNDDELHELGQITGADFEVVDTSGLVSP